MVEHTTENRSVDGSIPPLATFFNIKSSKRLQPRQAGVPRSDFGKAVRYMLERWTGLTRFVENPRIPLDNHAAERALRGPVVGRKNHYGSRSQRGTQVAALFYTLCETAKLVGVDPHAYLLRALHAAIAQPGASRIPKISLRRSRRRSLQLSPAITRAAPATGAARSY